MIVLFSPTKTQKSAPTDEVGAPFFPEITQKILNELKTYTVQDIKRIYKVSDKLAQSTYDNFADFNEINVAINSYQGSTFKNMNAVNWSSREHDYANQHLVILSALYGIVTPFSRIGLYRLDFLTQTRINLYDLWRKPITDALNSRQEPLINLASKEYADMIDFAKLAVPFVTLEFKEETQTGFVTKATYAKIARGKMADLILRNQVSCYDQIKHITFDGYQFNANISNDSVYIFTR